jgi:uncharacterized protein YceK
MNFKNFLITAIISALLAGCGSGTQTTTDPSKLKPLTDAEKAEIKKQDEAINAEEGQSYDAKKKK